MCGHAGVRPRLPVGGCVPVEPWRWTTGLPHSCEQRSRPGQTSGSTSCLLATLARRLLCRCGRALIACPLLCLVCCYCASGLLAASLARASGSAGAQGGVFPRLLSPACACVCAGAARGGGAACPRGGPSPQGRCVAGSGGLEHTRVPHTHQGTCGCHPPRPPRNSFCIPGMVSALCVCPSAPVYVCVLCFGVSVRTTVRMFICLCACPFVCCRGCLTAP